MRTIDCAWLLTAQGWREQQRLTVNAAGWIESVEPVGVEAADEHLHGWVIPGMCNVHSHAHQRLIAGLTGWREPGRSSFWSWRDAMYRALRLLDVEGLELIAECLYAELLEGGYTATGEFHYVHRVGGCEPIQSSRALQRAASSVGMGLTLLPVWYCYGGFGRQPLLEAQQRFHLSAIELIELIEALRSPEDASGRSESNQVIGLAPHSLRAVELGELRALLSALPTLPVHIHIAEQPVEVEECLTFTGLRPIEFLFANSHPDDRWCLVHATHCQAAELQQMREAGVVAGLCPITEADLGDGIFPAQDWLHSGGQIAIGSDSNVCTSAPQELRQLEWSQRQQSHQRNVLLESRQDHIGASLWLHAARAGAKALQQPCGAIEPGLRADLVELQIDHPLMRGLSPDQAMDSYVLSHQGDMIASVWVAGECRVVNGRHHDRDQLLLAFSALRQRLMHPVMS